MLADCGSSGSLTALGPPLDHREDGRGIEGVVADARAEGFQRVLDGAGEGSGRDRAGIAPPSPTPLTPNGLRQEGLSMWWISIGGISMGVGIR